MIIDDEPQYWTALYMRSETFKRYINSEGPKETDYNFIAVDLLTQAVTSVVSQWAAIAKHLKAFIVDHHLLLDPEGHDRLLFDDDSFSRSRKYFWVINFLAECDSRIDENLQEIQHARSIWMEKLGSVPPDLIAWGSMDREVLKLREIQNNLRVKRSETIALRDGVSILPTHKTQWHETDHTALLRQRRNGKPRLHPPRRERQAPNLRLDLLRTPELLHLTMVHQRRNHASL